MINCFESEHWGNYQINISVRFREISVKYDTLKRSFFGMPLQQWLYNDSELANIFMKKKTGFFGGFGIGASVC